MIVNCYRYFVWRRVWKTIPTAHFEKAYADAAAWLERNPGYDAHVAISAATEGWPEGCRALPAYEFRERFGQWAGDDEGVLILCFASVSVKDWLQ